MSNYEFWDELGKIFNAVVAYQEKSVEFNKRFINPWIRLGNVFDKQDRNREAVAAYQKAIEIDPANAQNWCDLGNAYFRTEAYDQAIHAFQKAIELDPQLGWPYSNLALAYVTQDDHEQAIFLYQKSIELLQDSKDKAVSWNRLGNLYRKLNEYDLAVQAFQKADELDNENAGFRDELDEIPAAPAPVNLAGEAPADPALEMVSGPIELIVEQSQVDEAAQVAIETAAVEEVPAAADAELAPAVAEAPVEVPAESPAEPVTETVLSPEAAESTAPEAELAGEMDVVQTEDQIGRLPEELAVESSSDAVTVTAEDVQAEAPVMESLGEEPGEESPELVAEAVIENPDAQAAAEPAPVSVQEVVETFTESIIALNTTTETTDLSLVEEPEQQVESVPAEEVVPVSVLVEASGEAEAVVVSEPVSVEEPTEIVAAPEAVMGTVETPAEAAVETEQPVEAAVETEPLVEAAVETEQPVEAAVETEQLAEAAVETGSPAEAAVETDSPAEAAPSAAGDVTAPEAVVEAVAEDAAETVEAAAESEAVVEQAAEVLVEEPAVEPAAVNAEEPSAAEIISEPAPEPAEEPVAEAVAQEAQPEAVMEEAGEDPEAPQNAAYEEFLKDDEQALNVLTVSPEQADSPAETGDGPVEPVTKLDDSGELQIEMDTKNAHVWNELGNVYFNNGAVDDSIIAYSKAIELDRWFAWPYSNLALAYVQKGRFPEAVLLYQRSIELFSGEKDKAISWNRLGNVYRRLNDYEHAIEAYQRADELDPDNTTLSLQSRFSLLGSYQMEQNASYAA